MIFLEFLLTFEAMSKASPSEALTLVLQNQIIIQNI
jgi:hypothetical protein